MVDNTKKTKKKHHPLRALGRKSANVRREFVEFINRGSIIDLAIGVAVGGAFNTIVNSFVNDIIMPIVGLIAGGVNFNNLAIHIPNFFGANDEATIAYGKFLQACLQFFIIAWVFFMIVKTMNNFHRKRESELAKIEKSIEENEEELALKLDAQAKKDGESKSTRGRSKLESKAEAALETDAKRRHVAREERVAAEKAAAKAKADSAKSSTSKS